MNIIDYIKGARRGKAAHQFEYDLMRDPFLAEAMEGYDQVRGDHAEIIAKLQKKVSRKAKRRHFRQPKFIWSSIVAATSLVAFIAFYFLAGFHLGNKRGLKNNGSVKTEEALQKTVPGQSAQPEVGFAAYETYVRQNVPPTIVHKCVAQTNAEAKIRLEFSTDAAGRPQNLHKVLGICPELDALVVRLVENGAPWTPGQAHVVYEISF